MTPIKTPIEDKAIDDGEKAPIDLAMESIGRGSTVGGTGRLAMSHSSIVARSMRYRKRPCLRSCWPQLQHQVYNFDYLILLILM